MIFDKVMTKQFSTKASSEALFFDFTEFHKANSFERRSQVFYELFLGFAEGDGCYSSCFVTNKRYFHLPPRQRVEFKLGQKDPTVLYFIQSQFGFGYVYARRDGMNVWEVSKKDHVKLLCLLAKNNTVVSRIICYLKIWCGYFNLVQVSKPRSSLSLLTTGWFAGFIDAEGCFHVHNRLLKNKNNEVRKSYRFSFSQKTTSEFHEYINKSLNGGNFRRDKKEKACMSFKQVQKKFHLEVLLPYFDKFLLLTEKKLKVAEWKKELEIK